LRGNQKVAAQRKVQNYWGPGGPLPSWKREEPGSWRFFADHGESAYTSKVVGGHERGATDSSQVAKNLQAWYTFGDETRRMVG